MKRIKADGWWRTAAFTITYAVIGFVVVQYYFGVDPVGVVGEYIAEVSCAPSRSALRSAFGC